MPCALTWTATTACQAIARAMWEIARHERWIVEGAAGVALAGLELLAERMRGKTVAIIVCGRNIDATQYLCAVAEAGGIPL